MAERVETARQARQAREARHADPDRLPPTPGRLLGVVLTLALLPVVAAVVLARVRSGLQLDDAIPRPGCSGVQVLGPLVLVGVPATVTVVAVLAALGSLHRRAAGWVWLSLALIVTALAGAAATRWLPHCLG